MSNIIAFCLRKNSPRAARGGDASDLIGPVATEIDGAAFAHAADRGWLSDELRLIAARLEASVRSLGPELSAADTGLPLPFVAGFAGHLERPTQSLTTSPLALQPNLTPNGIEDTFYWVDQRT